VREDYSGQGGEGGDYEADPAAMCVMEKFEIRNSKFENSQAREARLSGGGPHSGVWLRISIFEFRSFFP
jgi:hypothetical protein